MMQLSLTKTNKRSLLKQVNNSVNKAGYHEAELLVEPCGKQPEET